MSLRLRAMGLKKYQDGFEVRIHEKELEKNFGAKPKKIFVCSMSDLFHKEVPFDFVQDVFDVILHKHPQHTFLILTKRPERILPVLYGEEGFWYLGGGDYIRNIWIGTSVESGKYLSRIDDLRKIRTQAGGCWKLFLSFEPLLGAIGKIDLSEISWVIVGGESGIGARPMNEDWVREIRDQAVEANIPLFYKQRMEGRKKVSMPELDRKIWDEYPLEEARAK